MMQSEMIKIIPKTEYISFLNRRSRKIVGCFDFDSSSNQLSPIIVLPAGYGETKRDSLYLSYYLVSNGFRVIRFDTTDSVGESDGEMLNYSMVTAKDDIISTIDFIQKKYGQDKTVVISSSLALRQAIKAASEDKRIAMLIGLVGVIDLQNTLARIYGEDVIDKLAHGESLSTEVINTFGFDMSVDGLRSAIHGKMHTRQTTESDLKQAGISSILYFSENDPWVQIGDIDTSTMPYVCKKTIPGGMHELRENPSAVKYLMRNVVLDLKRRYFSDENLFVVDPDLRSLTKQNKEEKERYKVFECSKETEPEFWKQYLKDYEIIDMTQEFKELLFKIQQRLSPLMDEDVLLDVGCGIGLLGREILKNDKSLSDLCYIAVDLIPDAIKASYFNNIGELIKNKSCRQRYPQLIYKIADVDSENFASSLLLNKRSVTKICCNLVLSYLFDPVEFLKKLHSLLTPGGKLVITSLKPFADMSPVYANLIEKANTPEILERARKLLHGAGIIKQKEKDGHYKFYSEEELSALLKKIGFDEVKTCRVFSDQIVLAVASKYGKPLTN